MSRILQSCIAFYLLFILTLLLSFTKTNSLQKFFFYSELVWITLYVLVLNFEIFFNTINLLNNAFFILVFTAIESLVIASIILLSSKKNF